MVINPIPSLDTICPLGVPSIIADWQVASPVRRAGVTGSSVYDFHTTPTWPFGLTMRMADTVVKVLPTFVST